MIHYLIRFPLWLLVILARYPLAFLAVAFFQSNKQLTFPFKWLDTIDNNLDGDYGWKTEHLSGSNPSSYWNQVRWLWKNGGNRFNYFVIGVPSDSKPTWAFWIKKSLPWPQTGKYLDLRIGWSDYSLQGRCKYVFTLRRQTKP